MNLRLTLLTLSAAALLLGCSTRTGEFTVISTRTLTTVAQKGPERVKGSSCSHWALFGLIPFGAQNHKAAIDDALSGSTEHDVLVDAVTYQRKWGVLLYGQDCFVVEGTPAKIGTSSAAK